MSLTQLSVYISYLLRHQPEAIGLAMDAHGWVSVAELIEKANAAGRYHITESILDEIVRTDNKGCFRYSEDGTKIKACQGHSISWVEPELTYGQPPEYLYHGTTENAYRKILESGFISKMGRHAVHMQAEREKALQSAMRWKHEIPVVLKIDSAAMHTDGMMFGMSENGVWCSENVPVNYIVSCTTDKEDMKVDVQQIINSEFSGTCGERLTWRLEGNNLYVEGKGKIADYEYGWWGDRLKYRHKYNVECIHISDGCTSIGSCAFRGFTSLKRISIPDSVTEIGERAFEDCASLMSMRIPRNIKEIGECAFKKCISLSNITILNAAVEIRDYAFEECTGLRSITLPNNVKMIGEGAFFRCTGLANLKHPDVITPLSGSCEKSFTWRLEENTLYISGRGELRPYFSWERHKESIENVVIEDGCTAIMGDAFAFFTGLRNITIPASVTTIGMCAFERCTSLTSIILPNSITELGRYAFCGCTSLQNITFPDAVIVIGEHAFKNCNALSPETLRDMGRRTSENIF